MNDERNGKVHGLPQPERRAIILVFTNDGNVAMQATGDVTAADYILGAFNLTRQANRVLDSTGPQVIVPLTWRS